MKREGNHIHVIFWWKRFIIYCSGVAIKYGLYKNIGYDNVCINFEMFKVKVPLIFFGAVGFPPRGEGRYSLVRSY